MLKITQAFDIRLNIWSSGNMWKIVVSKRKHTPLMPDFELRFLLQFIKIFSISREICPKSCTLVATHLFLVKPLSKNRLVQVEWRTAPI